MAVLSVGRQFHVVNLPRRMDKQLCLRPMDGTALPCVLELRTSSTISSSPQRPFLFYFQSKKALTALPGHSRIGNSRNPRALHASLLEDAPFAASILASIAITCAPILPFVQRSTVPRKESDSYTDGEFSLTDVRYGVMTLISFIPIFNWMTWIFAWLDSKDGKYLAFAAVYAAPYLKSGLSVSPEESWLPLASFLACIFHVQADNVVNSGNPKLGSSQGIFPREIETIQEQRVACKDSTEQKKQENEKKDQKDPVPEEFEEGSSSELEMKLWDDEFLASQQKIIDE